MQFPPEVIPDMYKLWEEGYEVVEGVKKKRQKESLMYKLCAGTFYSFLKNHLILTSETARIFVCWTARGYRRMERDAGETNVFPRNVFLGRL